MRKLFFLLLFFSLTLPPIGAQTRPLLQKALERRFDRNSAENSGPEPDYSNLYYWAASPYKHDNSDSIPAFLAGERRDSLADVFFIHPTSYTMNIKYGSWNADLTDTAVSNRTDARAILYQASVFNGSCRVFAPRYRQANLKAFFVRTSPSAQKAFDLAYGDVRKAFQYYLDHENHGRPIIIASHSQGSLMAIRLLKEFFDGKPLQQQLVCAYIIGYQIKPDDFKYIPVGTTPSQTGCFVGWRGYRQGEIPRGVEAEKENSVCVNPLTWTTQPGMVSRDSSKGALYGFNKLVTGEVSAGIEPNSKILWVSLPEGLPAKIKKLKNLHIYDYNLFWMDIRQNVKLRVDTYLTQHR